MHGAFMSQHDKGIQEQLKEPSPLYNLYKQSFTMHQRSHNNVQMNYEVGRVATKKT